MSNKLSEFGDVIQGITPYDKYRGQDPEIIKNRSYHFSYKKDNTCGPWLDGVNVTRYLITESNEWLSYGMWLAAPREKKYFVGLRLLFREVPGQDKRIQACLTKEESYYGHSITPFKPFEIINEKQIGFILSIVNSKLISWYGRKTLPNFSKQTFPKVNPKDVKELPIHKSINNLDAYFTNNVDTMLLQNKELQTVKSKFIKLLLSKFSDIKINNKLEDWTNIDFKTFTKELEKQKIKLSLSEQSDWIDFFEKEKAKANAIQQIIATTDKEIDAMVYKLYELTEEEIRIVEGE